MEAQPSGPGKLRPSPAVDHHPDQRGRLAQEHPQQAGPVSLTTRPRDPGGARGSPVCYRGAMPRVQRGNSRHEEA